MKNEIIQHIYDGCQCSECCDRSKDVWTEIYRTLPIETAAAIAMHFSECMPVREVAAHMGLNPKYVSTIINEGIDSLRENQKLASIWEALSE